MDKDNDVNNLIPDDGEDPPTFSNPHDDADEFDDGYDDDYDDDWEGDEDDGDDFMTNMASYEELIRNEDFEKTDFFNEKTNEMDIALGKSSKFEDLDAANRKLTEIIDEFSIDESAIRAFNFMEYQFIKIEEGKFDWLYDRAPMMVISQIFDFFDTFNHERHFKYLNFEIVRDLIPIEYFIAYFNQPFSANDDDVVTYGEIMTFQSTLLSVFIKVYVKSFLAFRPVIDATEIYTIDPFMRNEFRRTNLEYYMENFWDTNEFEIYTFLKDLFEEYILAGLPKWIMERGAPFAVHLLELVRLMFEYGLITFNFCKSLISYLYLTSETLKNLEQKIAEMDFEGIDVDKCRTEFRICREHMSEILIHIQILFSDVAFEDSLMKIRSGYTKIVYYEGFLFDDKASYNFFCSILIKYLTNYVKLNAPITSEELDRNLTIIFNFLADFQNDNFSLSLDLVRQSYFSYYMALTDDNVDKINNVITASASILDECNRFIESLKDNDENTNINLQLRELIRFIKNTFEENPLTTEFKLELCRNNFIGMWLSFVDMLDEGPAVQEIIDDALIILKDILIENYPGQSILLRGTGYTNFFNIIMKHDLSALIFLKEVFEKDSYLLFLSQDIFMLYLQIYKNKIDHTFDIIDSLDGDYSKLKNNKEFIKSVGTLFFYNAYFDTILEDHLIKIRRRKRYDLLLANELDYLIIDYILVDLSDPNFLTDYTGLTFKKELISHGLSDRAEIENMLAQQKDPKRILFQFYFSTLKLYNKATYKIYTSRIYNDIKLSGFNHNIKNMDISYPESILLRLEFVKLFERFFVFFPNHLITDRIAANKKGNLLIGENFIPSNYDQIERFLLEEFKWFSNFTNYHNNKSRDLLINIQKYIFKGLLSLVYKFLKGVMVHLTKLEDEYIINRLKQIIDLITDEFVTRLPQFKRMIEATNNRDPFNKLNEQSENILKTDVVGEDNPLEEIIAEIDNKEERINPNLKLIRTQLRRGIREINNLYADSNFAYVIKRCIRGDQESNRGQYIKKLFRSPTDLDLKNQKFLSKLKKVGSNLEYNTQFKLLKNKYMQIKTLYQENKTDKNKETNQFYNVLNSIKDSDKNLENIIWFFINQFKNLEFLIIDGRFHLYYLNNEFFFSAVIILDSLMSWNNKVRVHFFNILSQMSPEKRKNLLTKLWGTFFSLYLLVIFKTFMDDQWQVFWSLFYILSNFFQNFNEENNIKFKEFFNDTNMASGTMSYLTNASLDQNRFSIFFENYIMLENIGNFTQFWLNTDANILPSDRVEFFPVFIRMFTMVSEYLTGPCQDNQLKIYRYRIDIWNGIITRIIDDVDSNFYEVKLACLTYISSLLEGLNNEIISFMSSNFQIDKLYNLITRLTKKLYIRQKMANQKLIENRQVKNVLATNIKKFMSSYNQKIENIAETQMYTGLSSVITFEQENEHQIADYRELIKLYQKYSHSFSDHIIMRVIITTYVLLINMSFKIKFFEFFFKDKKKEVYLHTNKKRNYDAVKVEEIIIYQFLDNITSNIEIVYENKKEKKLMRMFYMIPAECFFLTEEMKDNFIRNLDYETTVSKHIDLFDSVDSLHMEMQANKTYYERFGLFYYLTTNEFFRTNQFVLYIGSMLLNFLMLFYIIVDPNTQASSIVLSGQEAEDTPVTLVIRRRFGEMVLMIIAIIIAGYSLFLTILWLSFKYRLEIDLRTVRKENLGIKITPQLRLTTALFDSLLLHPRFISFFLHFTFTLLGLILDDWFFYTLNLFLLTNLSQTINYILKSIIKHYGKLLITLVLTILVIFCYSFLAYLYYRQNPHQDFEGVCDTFMTCFVNSVNLGMRLGGGISDAFNLVGDLQEDMSLFFGRFFFDLTFFIFIKLIFLNLIAGIIIDTFSDMRDELTKRRNDAYNVCPICGKSRWQLEKEGILFRDHTNKNHSLWRYLYYMIRLRTVKASNFTGIEQYVSEKTNKDDSSWIPQNIYLKDNVNIIDIDDSDDEKE